MRRCSDGRPRRRPRVAVPSRHRLSHSAGRGNPQACRACGAGPPPGGPRSQCEAYGRCPRPAGVSCGTPAPGAPWRSRWLGGVWVPPLSVPLGVARLAHPRPRGPGSTRLDDPRWSRCRPGFREGRAPGGTRSRPVVPGSGKLAPVWHRGRGPLADPTKAIRDTPAHAWQGLVRPGGMDGVLVMSCSDASWSRGAVSAR